MMEKYHTQVGGVEVVLPYIEDLKVGQLRKIQNDETMLETFFGLLPEEGSPEREAVEDLTIEEFKELIENWGSAVKSSSPKA